MIFNGIQCSFCQHFCERVSFIVNCFLEWKLIVQHISTSCDSLFVHCLHVTCVTIILVLAFYYWLTYWTDFFRYVANCTSGPDTICLGKQVKFHLWDNFKEEAVVQADNCKSKCPIKITSLWIRFLARELSATGQKATVGAPPLFYLSLLEALGQTGE